MLGFLEAPYKELTQSRYFEKLVGLKKSLGEKEGSPF